LRDGGATSADETDGVIRGVAGGEMSEADFRDWIAERSG
jgi:hypothetical protein